MGGKGYKIQNRKRQGFTSPIKRNARNIMGGQVGEWGLVVKKCVCPPNSQTTIISLYKKMPKLFSERNIKDYIMITNNQFDYILNAE